MAKKATTRATKKAVGIRGGTSKQHARAGRLGGLAPHICRGSECTKMRKAASAKKATLTSNGSGMKKATVAKKRIIASAAKGNSLYGSLLTTKAVSKKRGISAVSAKAVKSKKVTPKKATRSGLTGFFEGLFEDTYAAPRRVGRSTNSRSTKSKTASRVKVTSAKRGKVTSAKRGNVTGAKRSSVAKKAILTRRSKIW